MKRLSLSIRRLGLTTSASLTLLLALIAPVSAHDTPPAAAPAALPKAEEKSGAAVSKPATGDVQSAAQEKKPDPEALLIELFKKEESITNSLGMVMVWMPEGYRVAQYEVTQTQFEEVMKSNPSRFPGPQHPVENVTWDEANEFCRKLSEKEIADAKLPKGYSYSLPTEQQWESFLDEANLKDAVTSYLGDRRNPENVGGLGPNRFGLYDVRGNVWEWCSSPVARGASWRSFEDFLAVSFRWVGSAGQRYDDVGFRVILQGAPEGGKSLSATQPPPQKQVY